MYRVISILIACALLSACGSSQQQAPVYERSQPPTNRIGHHTVSSGETMFSISWRYGLDYRTLAGYNGIKSPYTIYPGQKLRLSPSASSAVTAPAHQYRLAPQIQAQTQAQTQTQVQTQSRPPPRSQLTTKTYNIKQGKIQGGTSVSWRWPSRGKIVNSFSSAKGLNKGIDIAGRLGEPVIAAAPGVVVYAGSGIRGYGNLLIIKHDERFLSAYAYNQKLLVKEAEQIKAGQKIAEIGSSGTDRAMLHFEIRRDGTPVDPLGYLPKR